MEFCAEISSSGFTRPLPCLTKEDKITLIQTVALHYVLLRSKAEMDQFCEGLKSLGVLHAIRKYPDLMSHFFTHQGVDKLTAG